MIHVSFFLHLVSTFWAETGDLTKSWDSPMYHVKICVKDALP